MAIVEVFEVKTSAKFNEEDLIEHLVKLKTKCYLIFAIADSGSPMSLLNKTIARRLQLNDSSTIFKFIPTDEDV